MSLAKLIEFAINNSDNSDKSKKISHLEFEIRFGKYNRISSNIRPAAFFRIFARAPPKKTFEFIEELFYESGGNEPLRKRMIYKDSKNFVKNIFENLRDNKNMLNIKDNLTDYCRKYTNPPAPQYITKSKVMKGETTNLFKYEIVRENIHTAAENIKSQNPTLKKYKLRCSWSDKMWIFDATVLLIEDFVNKKTGLFYEVEIEYDNATFLKDKYTADDVLEEAIKNMNYITTIIDCAKMTDLETEIKYNLYNAVVTMERKDLPLLQNALYSVVDKADGERRFIYIDSAGSIFQYNPTEGYINKVLIEKNTKINMPETLIDCELIKVPAGDCFYGFDLLFFKGADYRNYNLDTRIELLKKVISELTKTDKTSGFKYATKTFYYDAFKNVKNIWENREKLFPYKLDGLIFTPIRGAYLGNLPNLKYKPLVSIDVRLLYIRDTNFTEFHANGHPINIKGNIINAFTDYKTKKTYYKSRVTMNNNKLKEMRAVNNKGILGMVGRVDGQPDMANIVEMEFIPDESRWQFLRVREDKDVPNAGLSIISALNAIADNITVDELSKLKYRPSPFEEIAESSNGCATLAGFNFSAGYDAELIDFYKFGYKNILGETSGKSILVLGCDVSILSALYELEYNEILIIEPSCLEVYGQEISEGYKGLIAANDALKRNNAGKKINIVWGDSDISGGLRAFSKSGQGLLNAYKNKSFDTVFIKSFETALYNEVRFDKTRYTKYMKALDLLAKKYIIGIYTSGENMLSHLKNNDCLILKNKELHPLWKIYKSELDFKKSTFEKAAEIALEKASAKNKQKSVKHDAKAEKAAKTEKATKDEKAAKNKSNIFTSEPIMIEIQRARNSFISEYQPLIFDDDINKLLRENNLSPTKYNSFSSLYKTFKKENISEHDTIIFDITKYFISNK